MTPARHADNDWDGILEDGELVLWQGQPEVRLCKGDIHWYLAIVGLGMIAMAVLTINTQARDDWLVWPFGVIFGLLGLLNVLAPPAMVLWQRRQTFYSLTNRRAFIASRTLWWGKVLKSYAIDQDTVLELIPGETSTIFFGIEQRRDRKRRHYMAKTGFEHLRDSAEPLRWLKRIRTGEV